jgi:hypothetical protein
MACKEGGHAMYCKSIVCDATGDRTAANVADPPNISVLFGYVT